MQKNYDGGIKLIETHYKTKKISSETAKVISRRVLNEARKEIKIGSFLEYDELIYDWRVDNLYCRVYGFEQLAKDVLKFASMMANKKSDVFMIRID